MKKINKIALLLTVCIVSVALVLVLAACDDPSDEHQHSWSAWSLATEPTQDTVGSVTRTCSADGCAYGGGVQSVEIPALSSDLYTAGADTATCGEAGTKTYSVTVPGYEDVFTFSVVSAAKGNHTLSPKSAVAATCTKQGAEAYWECDTCRKKFSDENGANEISAPVATEIDPDNHTIVPHNRVAAKCNADGCEAYWECTDCGKLYKQPVYTTDNEIEVPVVISKTPNTHKLTPHAATTAKCNADGNIAYWTCDDCGKYFSDAQGITEITQEATVISKTTVDHTPVYVGESATCTTDGVAEHWDCEVCGKTFLDEACAQEGEPEVVLAHHKLTSVAASTETKTLANSAGYSLPFNSVAYYKCNVCNKKFSDADGKIEVTNVLFANKSRVTGILLSYGLNKVYSSSSTVIYQAEGKGQYTFELDNNWTQIVYWSDNVSTVSSSNQVYLSGAWKETATDYSKFVIEDKNVCNKAVVNMEKGDFIQIFSSSKINTITIEKDPILYYGDNAVFIKSNNVLDENVYTFVPTESKYSMTVAEGLYVMMNGDEFADAGNGEMTVNFECTPGQEVTFSFSGSVIGTYPVTIGEFVKPITIAIDSPVSSLLVNNYQEVEKNGNPMATIVVDDSVVAGRYTLTISGITRRFMQSQSQFWFAKNSNDNCETLRANNGTADVTFNGMMMQASVLDTEDTESDFATAYSGNTWTITLNLNPGDKLTFISGFLSSSAFEMSITMTAAA